MFSISCCGNVIKQIIDISNVTVDLSNVVLDIAKTVVDISNLVTDISNIVVKKEDILEKCDCLIFERNVEQILDASNVQIHVVDAMNSFLNETIESESEKDKNE